MKHYCAKPSGIMLTQLGLYSLATKHTHRHTAHTLYTLARMMPVTTVSYYTYIYVEDDVKGININDYTSKSQGWIAIYLPIM